MWKTLAEKTLKFQRFLLFEEFVKGSYQHIFDFIRMHFLFFFM